MKKIPVGQTIAEAYRFTFLGLERVLGATWLPILIMTVGTYFVSGPYLSAEAAALGGDISQLMPAMASMFAFEIVTLILMGVVGVAITREILKPLDRPKFLRFSLGAAEFRLAAAFVGLIVLLMLFIIVLIIVAAAAGSALSTVIPATPGLSGVQRALGVSVLLGLCLSPILIYLVTRLSFLVAPAVVMEGKFGIERSWQLTKSNFWRIIGIGLAVVLPLALVAGIVEIVILGPGVLPHPMGAFGDKAQQLKDQAEQIRIMADKLPFLMGLNFVLAPFTYGLTFAASAIAYRALTAEQ